MKKTIIECDQCGNDLTTEGDQSDYRLNLHTEWITTKFKDEQSLDVHFCNIGCLAEWARMKNDERCKE